MVHDIDSATVALDHAQCNGLMGYPDILGKEVRVQLANLGEQVPMGEWEWDDVKCVAVGPIGFVCRSESRYHFVVPGGDTRTGTTIKHRFFPWSAVIVTWATAKRDEPDGQGNAAPATAVPGDA